MNGPTLEEFDKACEAAGIPSEPIVEEDGTVHEYRSIFDDEIPPSPAA